MNVSEFDNLKVKDSVRLSFSCEPNQVVVAIDRKNGMVETKIKDDEFVTYRNHYKSIEFVSHYDDKLRANNAAKKQNIMKQFDEWRKDCNNCPFKGSCDRTYGYVRAYTTSAINLCDALTM